MESAEPTLRPSIRTEVQVMFFDTDCAAVVHNIAYLRFIETARTLLAEQMGMGILEMAQSRVYPVVARTEIDYKRPAVFGDKLQIDGWLESLNRSRFWCGFSIRRSTDDVLMVAARQLLALVQMPAGRPVRLPPVWSVRYARLFSSARTIGNEAPMETVGE
jgi:YbgC/YbaW family acyl-CoA thioester hydrolase